VTCYTFRFIVNVMIILSCKHFCFFIYTVVYILFFLIGGWFVSFSISTEVDEVGLLKGRGSVVCVILFMFSLTVYFFLAPRSSWLKSISLNKICPHIIRAHTPLYVYRCVQC